MARLYLAFLGTNDYLPCTYYFGGREVKQVRFVQEASVRLFCRDWGPEDHILIFTTADAYRKNWLDHGHHDRDGHPLHRLGLDACLSQLGLKAQVANVPIPEGRNEDEIWQIFNIFISQLEVRDEAVFDITHALRSIPMLAIVALNYAKVLRQVNVRGIYYGAFEVLGSVREVEKMPVTERRVPIFDLSAFDRLLEWSTAIDRFLGSGDAGPTAELAKKAVQPLLQNSRGGDEAARAIHDLANQLQAFSQAIATCRGPRIGEIVGRLKGDLERTLNLEVVPPFKPLLEQVQSRMNVFDGDFVRDGLKATRWCLEHNLTQQGFTILQEFLVSFIATGAGLDMDNRNHREISSQAVEIFGRDLPQEEWRPPAGHNPEKTKSVLGFLQNSPAIVPLFKALTEFRNDLNHAGFRKHPKAAKSFAAGLAELLTKVEGAMGQGNT
jgi:CRISPR-associated Csx2 family protein